MYVAVTTSRGTLEGTFSTGERSFLFPFYRQVLFPVLIRSNNFEIVVQDTRQVQAKGLSTCMLLNYQQWQ